MQGWPASVRLAVLPCDTWGGKPGKLPSKSLSLHSWLLWQMWHEENLGCAGAPATLRGLMCSARLVAAGLWLRAAASGGGRQEVDAASSHLLLRKDLCDAIMVRIPRHWEGEGL